MVKEMGESMENMMGDKIEAIKVGSKYSFSFLSSYSLLIHFNGAHGINLHPKNGKVFCCLFNGGKNETFAIRMFNGFRVLFGDS